MSAVCEFFPVSEEDPTFAVCNTHEAKVNVTTPIKPSPEDVEKLEAVVALAGEGAGQPSLHLSEENPELLFSRNLALYHTFKTLLTSH